MRLANDSPYGLGASVFSRDTERGEAIARRMEAGAANVNDAMINYTVLELPMGGAKASGLGSRHGAGGIRKYCSQQAIVVTPKLAHEEGTVHVPVQAPHLAAAGARCSSSCTAAASATRALSQPASRRRAAGSPSSRSSSGIVVSALVWCTVAMPSSSAGVRLKGRSST